MQAQEACDSDKGLSGPSTVLFADAIFLVAWPKGVTCAKIPCSIPLIGQYGSNDQDRGSSWTFQKRIVRLGTADGRAGGLSGLDSGPGKSQLAKSPDQMIGIDGSNSRLLCRQLV